MTVDFSGIPKGATLEAMVTSNPVAEDAKALGVSRSLRYGGCSKRWIRHGDAGWHGRRRSIHREGGPASVTLGLTLTAKPPDDDEDMLFPLARGSIMAKATFTDPTGPVDNFVDAFTDYVTVFNIRPAQCELLFPVVSVTPKQGNYDTAISVTNPAYEDDPAAGGLTFTFYGKSGM